MKFIKLESRGGNYLVVAENVAWLRSAENGQTSVGIIGGQPLLVVGSIEEVAAKILAGSAPEEAEQQPAPPAPAEAEPEPEPEPQPVAAETAPPPGPQPAAAMPPVAQPAPALVEPAEPAAVRPAPAVAVAPPMQDNGLAGPPPARPAERPRIATPRGLPLAERLALAQNAAIKAG